MWCLGKTDFSSVIYGSAAYMLLYLLTSVISLRRLRLFWKTSCGRVVTGAKASLRAGEEVHFVGFDSQEGRDTERDHGNMQG